MYTYLPVSRITFVLIPFLWHQPSRQPCRSLLLRLDANQIFVLDALIPIFLCLPSHFNEPNHSQNVIVESHKKRFNRVELARRRALGRQFLELHDQQFPGFDWGDRRHARSDPFAIDHAFARAAFPLLAGVFNELSGLTGNVRQGLSDEGHGIQRDIALFENDGDVPNETLAGVVAVGAVEGFFLFPFWGVAFFS